ncbi:uncharacterized protein LOC143295341 [Babylonia areolata]|uniref:uncharacterized protein LOC143295341 n=1 Tax=Babylonia areolata TaxID=304850 RepID=UPI003FD64EA8
MAIMGKGSIKDKSKEEELRKEGGKKYAHLNEELHVSVEVFAELTEAYKRLSHGVAELKKFLTPDYSDDFRQQQMPDMMYMSNGDGHGCRGGFRGARGGWGGPAFARHDSRRGGIAPHRTGAPPMCNGMPHRPAVVSPPSQSSGYEDNDYSSSSHGGSYDNYENGYSSRDYGDSDYADEQGDSQYYGGDSSGQITECGDYYSYRGYNNHRDSWNTSNSSCRPMKSSVQDRATKNRFQPYGGY